jgi:hypothetical protein
MTVKNLANEFRPYYEVKSGTGGKYMFWYAVIELNHLFESIDHIGLTQKLDASFRLWLNCSTVNIIVGSSGTSAAMTLSQTYSITPSQNTFSNTFPLLVKYEVSNCIVPSGTVNIVAGVYVARPPNGSSKSYKWILIQKDPQ